MPGRPLKESTPVLLSVTPPVVPPPLNPVPAVTPVIVPPLVPAPALVITVPSGKISALPPPLIFTFPVTSNCCVGVVVPNPTLPAFGSVTSAYLLVTVPLPLGELMYRPVKLNSVLPGTMVGPSMFTPRKGYGASPLRNEVAVITESNADTPPVAAASRKYTNRAGCLARFVAVLTSFRVILNADSTLPVIGLLLFRVMVEFSAFVGDPVVNCTSRLAWGLVVPMPTRPLSKSEELITFAPVASNFVTKFCVPPPPIVAAAVAAVPAGLSAVPTPTTPPDGGGASTNEDSSLPPRVSASAAFNAYGTLTKSTRGCSTSFGRLTCTPNHRGSPAVNNSSGNPSF